MAETETKAEADGGLDGPQRRCILTGRSGDKAGLLRLVAGPDSQLAVDYEGKLPGRGAWLSLDKALIEDALAKKKLAPLAARALKTGPLQAPADLADRIEAWLLQRCLGRLGLEKKAGRLLAGFEKVEALIASGEAALLMSARDAGEDGAMKMARLAGHLEVPVLRIFDRAQLSLALGRENVVHAALKRGAAVPQLLKDIARLAQYRGERHLMTDEEGTRTE